jgi:hypothetical protein
MVVREVETRLLVESRRRCCLCVFLARDMSEKRVQIAHISRDRSDSTYDNLAVLCLDHHDQYDSRTSQSKGFTPDELREYKKRLVDYIQRWENAPHQIVTPYALVNDLKMSAFPDRLPQMSPLPSADSQQQEIGPLHLLQMLLHPKPLNEERLLLHEHNMLSEEIAEVGSIALDARLSVETGDPYCVVSIGDTFRWEWDVVLLSCREGRWHQVGRIPLPGQKGYQPVTEYLPGHRGGALSIQHIAGYGTGVFRKLATWYRVGPEGLVPLFSYPLRAYVAGWGMLFQRHILGRVVEKPFTLKHKSRLVITVQARYSVDPSWLDSHQKNEDTPLFSISLRVFLEWDADAHFFVPIEKSRATFDDAEALFNDDSDSFLRRYVRKIIQLVSTGSDTQRQWVRDFIEQCPSSPERARVEEVLSRQDA